MKIEKFQDFYINESKSNDIKLYRLSSYSVVDLNKPGIFYVRKKSELDPKMLKKKSKEIYLIEVKCSESNIDIDKSEKESAIHRKKICVVKDDKKCEIIKIEPYK